MAMDKLNVTITTPDKFFPPFKADSVSLVTAMGHIEILTHHADYLGNVEISEMTITNDGKVERFAVGGGALHVTERTNTVHLIVSSIETAEEIDAKRANEEKTKAETLLKAPLSENDHVKAEISLKKALNRLSVKDSL